MAVKSGLCGCQPWLSPVHGVGPLQEGSGPAWPTEPLCPPSRATTSPRRAAVAMPPPLSSSLGSPPV